MVTRPVFYPDYSKVGVKVVSSAAFKWSPGFSISQQRKNVEALHGAIVASGAASMPLEVSRKSGVPIGISLSAFNLGAWSGNVFCTVESVYQASKVFAGGIGPFPGWYGKDPGEVRQRIKDLGTVKIVAYKVGSMVWGLTPTRGFYDWLYCRALYKNPSLVAQLRSYDCFTDIAFNPVKSLNCQAYAVALYLSMLAQGVLEDALTSKETFLRYHPHDVVELRTTNAVSGGKRGAHRSGKMSVQLQLL